MPTADSAQAVQFANSTTDHNWRPIPDGHSLQITHTDKVVAIQDMSSANGAQLTRWPPTGTAHHRWRFIDSGGGRFRTKADPTDKVVDVSGVSTADGARVTQWDWLGAANQQWRLAWAGFGAFALHGRHSDKVLEVSDRSTADGVPVTQWSDLSLANQRRRVIPGT